MLFLRVKLRTYKPMTEDPCAALGGGKHAPPEQQAAASRHRRPPPPEQPVLGAGPGALPFCASLSTEWGLRPPGIPPSRPRSGLLRAQGILAALSPSSAQRTSGREGKTLF